MNKVTPQIFIGTSGWSYKHWEENFYPEGLKSTHWLEYYSQIFQTVEINTTFYHLPLESTIRKWYSQVPENFFFSVKASRYVTHQKRLVDCEKSLDIFHQRIQQLKRKLGPILFQFPPSFRINRELMENFIKLLKEDCKYVFEFRHASWFTEEIYNLLLRRKISLCFTDLNGRLSPEEITSNFIYIRLHGPKKAYKGSYDKQALNFWKEKIMDRFSGYSVYCYFDNDEKGFAIQDAKTLCLLLS